MELLRFGPFELDPQSEELKRAGLVLRLPRQPFRILSLLLARAGEVVTREEIQQAIWGGETFVDFEHGINSAIRQIRYVLGDNAEAPRYLRTLPRRGYSFIANVERVARPGDVVAAAVAPVTVAKKRVDVGRVSIVAVLLVALAAMSALVAQLHSASRANGTGGARRVAVQPFRWIGPAAPGLDARAFAEEIGARIAALPPQRVQHAGDVGADVLIDGTIRQAGGLVRVIVSGVDAKTRTQLWSETIERPAARNDGIAVEVAHRTMLELARRYLPPPRREPLLLTKARQAALAPYRQARLERARSKGYDVIRIGRNYEAAIREEPRFAEAWSGLAELRQEQSMIGQSSVRAEAADEARRFALRALSLQPANAEALAVLGFLAGQRDYDAGAAEDFFRRATAADPEYVEAHVSLASVLAMRGRGEEALRAYATARALDPASYDLSMNHPLLNLHARRFEDARARFREVLAVNPESPVALWGVMSTHIAQRQWAEATQLASMVRPVRVDEGAPSRERFLRVYRGLAPFIEEGVRERRLSSYFAATYYAQGGDADHAFAALERAFEARSPLVAYLRVDPRFDEVRDDPRYRDLLVRARLVPR